MKKFILTNEDKRMIENVRLYGEIHIESRERFLIDRLIKSERVHVSEPNEKGFVTIRMLREEEKNARN